jgi:hypothetical protein
MIYAAGTLANSKPHQPRVHFEFMGPESGVRKFIPNGVVPDRQSKLASSRPDEAAEDL